MARSTLAILLLTLVSCGTVPVPTDTGPAAEDCGPPIGERCASFPIPAIPDGWVGFGTGCGLGFRAPPGLTRIPGRGIDSCVFEYEGASCSVRGEAGQYSGALRELEKAEGSRVGQASVNGVQAKIVTARLEREALPFVAAAHFPEPGFSGSVDFVLACATAAAREQLLPVLGTILFVRF